MGHILAVVRPEDVLQILSRHGKTKQKEETEDEKAFTSEGHLRENDNNH